MTTYKVVVDGSNIATEGRSLPSLNQLDEAVQCFIEEHPGADVLVIVDTSFAHRIDPTESEIFESAYNAGEIITPPAGTIGRGDSFILKVADKLGATVFSNDSRAPAPSRVRSCAFPSASQARASFGCFSR